MQYSEIEYSVVECRMKVEAEVGLVAGGVAVWELVAGGVAVWELVQQMAAWRRMQEQKNLLHTSSCRPIVCSTHYTVHWTLSAAVCSTHSRC